MALPTRQLDVFALPSAQAALDVPDDLNRIRLDGGPSRVTWRDENGPVLFNGRRRDELTTTDERSYVLLGEATVTPGDGLSTVMDPNLPPWIGEEIRDFCRGQIAHYTIPRHIRFVDGFPMTITGKIQKYVMRQETIAALGLSEIKTA